MIFLNERHERMHVPHGGVDGDIVVFENKACNLI